MPVFEKSTVNLSRRVAVTTVFVAISFLLLLLRLWYLQILRGDYFREKSEENRLRTVYVPATRGLILDRNGKVIVKNRPSFDVELIPEDAPSPEQSLRKLAEIVEEPPEMLLERSRDQRRRRRFEPRLILRDISRDKMSRVLAHKYELPGIIINVTPTRDYLYHDFAAHVLGYTREITKAQLEAPSYSGYQPGDLVGQYGVEAKWEKFLQGTRGLELVIVNATGSRIGEYSYQPDIAGHNVTLTIDYDVQKAADDGLEGLKGAVVAMDPRTGEVLAMSSAPRFDPNVFTGELDPEVWNDLSRGSGRKLNNRALQGVFPPGSVFKSFMAVAGLSEGVMTPAQRVSCPGYLFFANRNYHCHKKTGHGSVDLKDALIQSCDVYFYTVGNRLGVDRIHDYAARFGLGEKTDIDLLDEARGLIPSTEWKRSHFSDPANQKWFPGETLSVAIGQGAVTTTPLQIARSLSALANGGKVFKPLLVRKIESQDGTFKDEDFQPKQVKSVDADQKYLDLVKEALVGVVYDPRGTGHRAALEKFPDIKVGGKSGTAQVAGLDVGHGERFKDHAWFAAFAPADKPEIVVAALVENGGHGGVAAAPIVKKVMEAYFIKSGRVPVEPPAKPGAKAAAPTPPPQNLSD